MKNKTIIKNLPIVRFGVVGFLNWVAIAVSFLSLSSRDGSVVIASAVIFGLSLLSLTIRYCLMLLGSTYELYQREKAPEDPESL